MPISNSHTDTVQGSGSPIHCHRKANVKINIHKGKKKWISILRGWEWWNYELSHIHSHGWSIQKSSFPKLSLPTSKWNVLMFTDIYSRMWYSAAIVIWCQLWIQWSLLCKSVIQLEPVQPLTREAAWPAHNHAAFCLLHTQKKDAEHRALTFPQVQLCWAAAESNFSHPAQVLSAGC